LTEALTDYFDCNSDKIRLQEIYKEIHKGKFTQEQQAKLEKILTETAQMIDRYQTRIGDELK